MHIPATARYMRDQSKDALYSQSEPDAADVYSDHVLAFLTGHLETNDWDL